jgi:putative transposase
MKNDPLEFNHYYHIFNRANGNERLFITKDDYQYFIKKLQRFLKPLMSIYSYCFLPNHFHLLIKTKDITEIKAEFKSKYSNNYKKIIIQSFSNLFNSYTKSFNKVHSRNGKLFEQSFKRKWIISSDIESLKQVTYYIHRNPIHHNFVRDYKSWNYSSYKDIISNKSCILKTAEVLQWFGGKKEFEDFHEIKIKEFKEEKYFIDI